MKTRIFLVREATLIIDTGYHLVPYQGMQPNSHWEDEVKYLVSTVSSAEYDRAHPLTSPMRKRTMRFLGWAESVSAWEAGVRETEVAAAAERKARRETHLGALQTIGLQAEDAEAMLDGELKRQRKGCYYWITSCDHKASWYLRHRGYSSVVRATAIDYMLRYDRLGDADRDATELLRQASEIGRVAAANCAKA